jgi:ABC-type transport system involved in multi-copper enzyme maturation permease subunit
MINFYFIGRIAFYEARLLFRSWGFRIFSGLVLIILALVNIAIISRGISTPHYVSSLSGSLPLNSLKLFNIFQGIIVAFMATEFFKRDRKHDSIQVVLASSFSNVEYFLGKALGILSVFLLLNLAILAVTFVIHFFFSSTLFALQPYLLYTVLICLPSLIFMIGLSFFLSSLLRSQAVVFFILLAYSFLVLVFIGAPFFGLFDSYAFYLPLMWSDFIGLGNIHSILLIRLAYLFLGLSFFFVSPLLFKRLRQSALSNRITGSLSIACLVLVIILGISYTNGKYADRNYRQKLRESSQAFRETQSTTIRTYDIQLEHKGKRISVTAQLDMVNESPSPLDTILMTLNPGLKVESVTQNGGPLNFRQDNHLLHITPTEPIHFEDSIGLTISYSGKIDERYCFLDIENNRYESRYRLWIYDIPKHYAFITSDFVHLTPECGWYPISGLPPGAAYPSMAAPSYSKYTLRVTTPKDLTAISQGKPETLAQGDMTQYTFKPEVPLPKISLTIGSYQVHEITIDNLTYSLYVRPGHDYFTPLMDNIQENDILTTVIRGSLDQLEVFLGVYYPYKRLALVEVPINIISYHRLWTVAHETVQPQLTFIPEMATICTYGQLRFPLQQEKSMRDRQVPVPWSGIQRGALWRFINWNLMGNTEYLDPTTAETIDRMRRNRIGFNLRAEIETQFDLMPNFVSFSSQVVSTRWPVLNFALESYMRRRVAAPLVMYRQTESGLSPEEESNLDLKDRSLAAMITDPNLETAVVHGALQAKAQTLLALIEAKYGEEDFDIKFISFLNRQKHSIITEQDLTDFLSSLGNISLREIVDEWYNGTQIPGYIIRDAESYDVIEGERKRTQVKFLIANPTSVDGITKIRLRPRPSRRGAPPDIYSRALLIPALTTIQVGIIIDEPPAQMTIDTFVSQNIPASIDVPFLGGGGLRKENPFRGEISKPYERSDLFPEDEIIVDNIDPGFEIPGMAKQHWLSRILQNLFNIKEDSTVFTGMNLLDPPAFWTQSTNQDFYGEFARSAYLKKSGEGKDRVVWNADIKDAGEYDISFYHSISQGMRQGVRARKQQAADRSGGSSSQRRGKKFFLVSVRNGKEEVEIDLAEAEQGWNLIGSFQLDAGPNTIELTDKNEDGYVIADAVKWVKKIE